MTERRALGNLIGRPGRVAANSLARGLVTRHITLDPRRLLKSHHHFNCSVHWWRGKLLLAYRLHATESRLALAELNPRTLQPVRNHPLRLPDSRQMTEYQDPRLFKFRDQLCLAYTGFDGCGTHQMLAHLTDELEVSESWLVEYSRRWSWEKNWGFFEDEQTLYCVYRIRPHRVLRILGSQALDCHEVAWEPSFSGGELFGGAPPVRVGNVFYSFFHARTEPLLFHHRVYSMGCYTFEAHPPFRPLGITPHPLLLPDPTRRQRGRPQVVFPCGAVRSGNRWMVSLGQQDRYCDIVILDCAKLESLLRPVSTEARRLKATPRSASIETTCPSLQPPAGLQRGRRLPGIIRRLGRDHRRA